MLASLSVSADVKLDELLYLIAGRLAQPDRQSRGIGKNARSSFSPCRAPNDCAGVPQEMSRLHKLYRHVGADRVRPESMRVDRENEARRFLIRATRLHDSNGGDSKAFDRVAFDSVKELLLLGAAQASDL